MVDILDNSLDIDSVASVDNLVECIHVNRKDLEYLVRYIVVRSAVVRTFVLHQVDSCLAPGLMKYLVAGLAVVVERKMSEPLKMVVKNMAAVQAVEHLMLVAHIVDFQVLELDEDPMMDFHYHLAVASDLDCLDFRN